MQMVSTMLRALDLHTSKSRGTNTLWLTQIAIVFRDLVFQYEMVCGMCSRSVLKAEAMILVCVLPVVSEHNVGADRLQLLEYRLDFAPTQRQESIAEFFYDRAFEGRSFGEQLGSRGVLQGRELRRH